MRKQPVEKAVAATLDCLSKQIRGSHNPSRLLDAQLLSEALIRVWYANGYEQFHRTYRVLHIEEEVHFVQQLKAWPADFPIELHWTSRPDAIVRERYGPVVVGMSWKTIDDANEYRRSFFSYDLQGLFEQFFGSLYVQQPFSAWSPEALEHWHQNDWSHRVDAIQTVFLQKGKRLKAEDVGGEPRFEDLGTDSFLIRPWLLDPHSQSIPFFNDLPNVAKNCAWLTQFTKPGNKSNNRLSGFNRSLIQQRDLASWIAALAADQVFPTAQWNNGQHCLDRVVIWDDPILRSDMQAEASIRETRWKMYRVAQAAASLKARLQKGPMSLEEYQDFLEANFPRSWGKACKTPVTCSHVNTCYQQPIAADEIPQNFEMRVPHHEAERLFQIENAKQ